MKKAALIAAIFVIGASLAWAQMGGQMEQSGGQMGMGGMGMGQGMMMPMMGMGGMGGGQMGMMGCGMMPGQGMMGMGGMGMGQGQMGMMYNPQMKKFLDETKDIRKEIAMKNFELMEAMRDPQTTQETTMKLQKELKALHIKLYEKAPIGMGW